MPVKHAELCKQSFNVFIHACAHFLIFIHNNNAQNTGFHLFFQAYNKKMGGASIFPFYINGIYKVI